ncbi:MAG: type II secretion system F family protein [Candidatus Thermoplasmatota archaeon]|nr:type II secretion system F family protein [Candidatus Thermoplasmatota archaeon]
MADKKLVEESGSKLVQWVIIVLLAAVCAMTVAGAYWYKGSVYGLRFYITAVALLLFSVALAPYIVMMKFKPIFLLPEKALHYVKPIREMRLRAFAFLLGMVDIFAAFIEISAVVVRLGIIEAEFPESLVIDMIIYMTAILLLVSVITYLMSLTVPYRSVVLGKRRKIGVGLFLASAIAFSILAILIHEEIFVYSQSIQWHSTDALFMMLAACISASSMMILFRKLQTPFTIILEDIMVYESRKYRPVKKSIIYTTLFGFVVLFGLFAAFVFLGISAINISGISPEVGVIAALLLFTVMVAVSFAVVYVSSARAKKKGPLYIVKMNREQVTKLVILGSSFALSALFLVLALLVANRQITAIGAITLSADRWLDFVVFAILAMLGPYGIYDHYQLRRIIHMEERFPDFLRDLGSSRMAGMTLPNSVLTVAKGEYGELTPEIRKMADQIKWNVPFPEALRLMGERIKTPLAERSISLINEANRSGGNVTDVLMAASNDARQIKTLEADRRITMGLYTVVVYVSFFVFLAVVLILYGSFIPEIIKASAAAQKFGGGIGSIQISAMKLQDYKVMYFSAGAVQAVGNGIVAGTMGNGTLTSGLKHGFIMLLITYLTFTLFMP